MMKFQVMVSFIQSHFQNNHGFWLLKWIFYGVFLVNIGFLFL